MKPTLIRLSRQYVTALRHHLAPTARALAPGGMAQELGRRAVGLGIETLDLAGMHEQALATVKLSNRNRGLSRRAAIFFTAANAPIEETHRAARQNKLYLDQLKETLGQRTAALAATNRQLQRGLDRRKAMQEAAEKTSHHFKRCLAESLQLQKRLRQLTHRVITAQEEERKGISRELHDEIAQTLLGINVRLLALKREVRGNHQGLKRDIAGTQRLVKQSAQSVLRVAREFKHA